MTTARRYNIRSLSQMREELTEWLAQSQDTLDNEESKDSPNDERVDTLTTRVDALQAAVDALEEIE